MALPTAPSFASFVEDLPHVGRVRGEDGRYVKNPEMDKRAYMRAYQRAWATANREKRNEQQRIRRAKSSDAIAAKRILKRDEVNAYQRTWYAEHAETERAKKREASKTRRLAKYGSPNADLAWLYYEVMHSPLVTCYLCGYGMEGKDCHLDHVIPLSRGGSHTSDNLRTACPTCNRRKGNRLLEELPPDYFVRERSVN